MRKRCAIVLPAYNEIVSLPTVISDLRTAITTLPEWEFSFYVVDDGSVDGTAEWLRGQPDLTVFTHPINLGYGASLKTALRHIETEWVFIIDADGSYPVEKLHTLFEKIRPEVQMVVGSRGGDGIEADPGRRFARWWLKSLVRFLTGFRVPDLNSGMRLFRRRIYLEFQHLLPRGFSFTSTITVSALHRGYTVEYVEIPYKTRIGKSHIRPVRDFLGFCLLIVRVSAYFEPMRIFNPLAIGALVCAAGLFLNAFFTLTIFCLVASLQFFLVGLVCDLIVRRSRSLSLNLEMA